MKKIFAAFVALCMSLCVFASPLSAANQSEGNTKNNGAVVYNYQRKKTNNEPSVIKILGECVAYAAIIVVSAATLGYTCCLGAEALNRNPHGDKNIFARAWDRFDLSLAVNTCCNFISETCNLINVSAHY